mgnify:CR=1 FL=1
MISGNPPARVSCLLLASLLCLAGILPAAAQTAHEHQHAGAAVANLQEYSNLLRTLAPGQRVAVMIRRGAEDIRMDVTLAER